MYETMAKIVCKSSHIIMLLGGFIDGLEKQVMLDIGRTAENAVFVNMYVLNN